MDITIRELPDGYFYLCEEDRVLVGFDTHKEAKMFQLKLFLSSISGNC